MSKVTPEDLQGNFHLLRSDPEKFLGMADQLVSAVPGSPDGYWYRSMAYERLKRHERALGDLNVVVAADKQWITYEARGNVLRALGRYREALDDYNRAEAADPKEWSGGFGHLFRAECHARLGNGPAALDDCAALPDNHWTPGLLGAPAGNKDEVIAEVRRLVARARAPQHSKKRRKPK